MTTGRIPKPLEAEPEPMLGPTTVPVGALDSTPVEKTQIALGVASSRVRQAAEAYRAGKPGLGEYHLVRAGLALARAIDDTETADTLAELRFVKVPGADS